MLLRANSREFWVAPRMLDEMDFHYVGTPTSEVDSFNLTRCAEVTKVKI